MVLLIIIIYVWHVCSSVECAITVVHVCSAILATTTTVWQANVPSACLAVWTAPMLLPALNATMATA